ncbi:hypothetical protein [Actinomadura alba]|uniref:Polyketide cyclase / dehydrase and lipid transport n=1 Tax=Actinomadura alba TaxID=406431 RepID=A0ABR7LUC4_9ACTN|nr:hypothetical protein [Actinomadura alba]MBC6468179.1 hypothetical protein [Actinomadura alba]
MPRKRRDRGIYVETLIRTDLAELWDRTQLPASHQRWDLRFHEIVYAPCAADGAQQFRYSVRPLPGLVIGGYGRTIGERHRPDGTHTSALRFGSSHRLALIGSGSGYWRYVPGKAGIRFLTGYDYQPGWGRLGTAADLFFRPLLGWATAWSFDRLRLWLETGRTPERALRQAVLELLGRIAVPGAALVCTSPPSVTVAVTIAALLLPPLPGTPAARRCLRRPPGGRAARAPATLSRLESP